MADTATSQQLRRRSSDEAVQVLLAPGERWGWEFHDLSPLVPPFPEPPPRLHLPAPPDESELAREAARAAGSGKDVFGVRLPLALILGLVVPVVVATVGNVATNDKNNHQMQNTMQNLMFGLWVLAIALIVVGLIRGGTAASRVAAKIQRVRQRYADQVAQAQAAHNQATADWQQRHAYFFQNEIRKLETQPHWGAVRLRSEPRRVDIFGDPAGWPALLATMGGSVLGSGQDLLVLDFSQSEAPSALVRLAAISGLPRWVVTLPDDIPIYDPLAGMAPDEVTDVLVEAFCSDVEGTSREQRLLTNRALGEVMDALGDKITMGRIWRGLRVLLGLDSAPTEDSELSTAEWRRLSGAFSDDHRAGVGQKLLAIEAQLHALRKFGTTPADAPPARARFECLSLSPAGAALTNELLDELFLQQAIRRVRRSVDRPLVIVVVGADDLQDRQLGALDQRAAQRDVKLVYLFRELAEKAVDRAGSGGAVGFFRLSNAAQAERAADWIGRDYSFKVSQLTEGRGANRSHTTGRSLTSTETVGSSRSQSHSGSLFGKGGGDGSSTSQEHSSSTAIGDNTGDTDGTSEESSTSRQRVYEHVVEPERLRALPLNFLLLVEFEGDRRVVAADVSPELAFLPTVIPDPLPDEVLARLGGR